MDNSTTYVDKTSFSVTNLSGEVDAGDRSYWLSKTPQQRFAAIEQLRQVVYGYSETSSRLQRILEVVERQ